MSVYDELFKETREIAAHLTPGTYFCEGERGGRIIYEIVKAKSILSLGRGVVPCVEVWEADSPYPLELSAAEARRLQPLPTTLQHDTENDPAC